MSCNSETGQPAATFPKIFGSVFAVIPDGAGGWYIGGLFSKIGSTPVDNLVHLNPNLTLDSNFRAYVNNVVYAVVKYNNTIYIGGRFSKINRLKRSRIAALNAVTGKVKAWNPKADADVYALSVKDAQVFAGGAFKHLGNNVRELIGALDTTTGEATAWAPSVKGIGLQPRVSTLLAMGKIIYIGGAFSEVEGNDRRCIAALDAVSGKVTGWNPAPSGDDTGIPVQINTIALWRNRLVVGGHYSTIAGSQRKNISMLDTSKANAADWNPGANGTVRTVCCYDESIYIGGIFDSVGGGVQAECCGNRRLNRYDTSL